MPVTGDHGFCCKRAHFVALLIALAPEAQASDYAQQQTTYLSTSVGVDCRGIASLGDRLVCADGFKVEFGTQDVPRFGNLKLGWKIELSGSRSDDNESYMESIDVNVSRWTRASWYEARALVTGAVWVDGLSWSSGVETNLNDRRTHTIALFRGESPTTSKIALGRFSVGPVIRLGHQVEIGNGFELRLSGLASTAVALHQFDAEATANDLSLDVEQRHWTWAAKLESDLRVVYSDPAKTSARLELGVTIGREFRSLVTKDQCWTEHAICLVGERLNAWSIFPHVSLSVPLDR